MRPGVIALVPAAGAGQRMNAGYNKQYIPIQGKPILAWTLERLEACSLIEGIVVLSPPAEVDWCRENVISRFGFSKVEAVIGGGSTRQRSVYRGLEYLSRRCLGEDRMVVIHDGVRPFIDNDLIGAVIEAAIACGAAAPGIPVKSTIKLVTGEGDVDTSLPRALLREIQTPQAFRWNLIWEAHRRARASGLEGTDDCSLVEHMGQTVRITPGLERNIKITTPFDLQLAGLILSTGACSPHQPGTRSAAAGAAGARSGSVAVGTGYDVHRLVTGRPLILGGVKLDYPQGLAGHSDADVLVHAIMDALLGAIGGGDIGMHFPPDDRQYEGASSLKLLACVVRLLHCKGSRVGNIDATIVAQKPRLGPHIPCMRANIARVCELDRGRVNIKATTTEGLGFAGRGEGIAAMSVASVIM